MTTGADLAQHPFFAGLDDAALAVIAGCAVDVDLPQGAYLLREGEPADRFFAVLHGRVAVELHRPNGGPVVLDSVHDGGIVGWSWLVPPHRYKFDARATTDTTALAFDGVCLRGKCDADPRLGYAVLHRVAQVMDRRLQSARVRLLDLYGAGS